MAPRTRDSRGGQGDLWLRAHGAVFADRPGDSSEIWRYRALVTERTLPVPADKADAPSGVVKLVARSPAEVSQGAGLGCVLSPEEAQARLDAFATPAKGND